jgi:REP element-mobilizing transposase RayT
MVLGHHAIFGAYGFWLPNDPRGSWSDFVSHYELYRRAGPATKTTETRSLANRPHDRQQRIDAKQALPRDPVVFNGHQALAAMTGFGEYVRKSGLKVWACSIMPDHVHVVVGRFHLGIEQIVVQLKGAATRKLVEKGIHPCPPDETGKRPLKCFARGEWKSFLDTPEDVVRAIAYVENNPVKDGLKPQKWPFVVPFNPAIMM